MSSRLLFNNSLINKARYKGDAMFKNKDYEAFCNAGLSEQFETLGNYNIFMQCDTPDKDAFSKLPDGYSFRLCRRDELDIWKRITTANPELITAIQSKESAEF